MNKMQILNTIQRATEQTKKGYWVVTVEGTCKTVANIVKTHKGSYAVTLTGEEFSSFMGAISSLIGVYSKIASLYEQVKTISFAGVVAELHGYNPQSKTFSHYVLYRSHVQTVDNRFLFTSPKPGKRYSFIDACFEVQECAANGKRSDTLTYAKFEAMFAQLIG